MVECHWKSTYGIDCFGCGFQRALNLLFQGEFIESLKLYPALTPIIFTFLFTALHLRFSFKNGAKYVIILFSSSVAIMLISYFYKLLL